MSNLVNRLAALHDATPAAVDEHVVASDLRRGRAALVARRRRRAAVGGTAALGVIAVGSLSYVATDGDRAPTRQAAPPSTVQRHGTAHPTATTGIQLVAYRGAQLPGYTVTQIPAGYVLQGISGSVLDVAEAGDHSPLDTFEGKLVVMLNDHAGPDTGQAVTVDGHPGRITESDGIQTLTYSDGTHDVAVQAWSNVRITRDQLVRFAEGVTVLPNAQEGHG